MKIDTIIKIKVMRIVLIFLPFLNRFGTGCFLVAAGAYLINIANPNIDKKYKIKLGILPITTSQGKMIKNKIFCTWHINEDFACAPWAYLRMRKYDKCVIRV